MTGISYEKVRRAAGRFAERFADFVYPPDIYCICCEKPIRPGELYSLCDECLQEILWANGKLCRVCGKLLEDWYPDDICGACRNRTFSFDRGITCVRYAEKEKKIIADLKYHGRSYLSRNLSEIIYDKLAAEECEFDIIVPVPMYIKKERQRGYNQAALLGKYLGRRTGKVCATDIIYRTRPTVQMSRLSGKERRKNLEGAFSVSANAPDRLCGKRVLLVDDIFTTGSTAQACSSLLKESGASEVILATVAAGANQRVLPNPPEKTNGGVT